MDDNELQSLLQQFKAVQKDISQSRQSSDARAAVAADIAKLPPMDEGIDQLKHLEAVDKAMTGAEEEARQQVSHSKKLVSHSEKLCNEMRTRRNAAQQDEDTARQAKTDAEAFKQNLRQVDATLLAQRQAIQTAEEALQTSQQTFQRKQKAFRDARQAFEKEREAFQQDRIAFEKEKVAMQEREKAVAAREAKLEQADNRAISRLETAFRDTKLGTDNQSSALKQLQEDSKEANSMLSAIKDNTNKIPKLQNGVDKIGEVQAQVATLPDLQTAVKTVLEQTRPLQGTIEKIVETGKNVLDRTEPIQANAAKIPDIQTKLQEVSEKTERTSTSLGKKLDDAAKERAEQPPMVTDDVISQRLAEALVEQEKRLVERMAEQQESLVASIEAEQESSRKAQAAEYATHFSKLEEMLNARLPAGQSLPLSQQLGSQPPASSQQLSSQRTLLSQHTGQQTPAAESSQASRKRARVDSRANDEDQAGGGAQREQPAVQVANADKEVDNLFLKKAPKDPLSDDEVANVKSVWGDIIFVEGFTEADKLNLVHRFAITVHGHDTWRTVEAGLKEAAAATEPFCVISWWQRKKKAIFPDKQVQGPDGAVSVVKDGSRKCNQCSKICIKVEEVLTPSGASKFEISNRIV